MPKKKKKKTPPGLAKKPGQMPPGQYKKRKPTVIPRGGRDTYSGGR